MGYQEATFVCCRFGSIDIMKESAYAELIELSKRSLQKFKDTGIVGSWLEDEDYKMNVKQQLIADIIYGYCQVTYHLEFEISDFDEMTHKIITALKAMDENE